MSLSAVRTYFQTRISEVDSTFVEWSGSFEKSNIPRNVKTKSYHVSFGEMTSSALNDQSTDDSFRVELDLFYRGVNNYQGLQDTAFDSANLIRLNCIKPVNAMSGANIKNVTLDRLEPNNINVSDNSMIITLQFTVRLVYSP